MEQQDSKSVKKRSKNRHLLNLQKYLTWEKFVCCQKRKIPNIVFSTKKMSFGTARKQRYKKSRKKSRKSKWKLKGCQKLPKLRKMFYQLRKLDCIMYKKYFFLNRVFASKMIRHFLMHKRVKKTFILLLQ